MWRTAGRRRSEWNLRRRITTTVRRRNDDEGDWFYSSEWWGPESDGHTVFRANSDNGNGVVSVVAFPSSRPSREYWNTTEKWLRERCLALDPEDEERARFRVLGYQWRSLRFNDDTRQSTAKVMAAYRISEPDSVFLMQQPHCLAVPYLKSMVSSGLATMASSGYDLASAARGEKEMNVLCVGHGGGSLPLFLASKIQGATVHTIEIDPLVLYASVNAMGFPSFSVISPSGERALPKPNQTDEILWKGTHERLHLHQSDAENYISKNPNLYDIVFIDAYDGDDIFPRALWDPDSPFLKSLSDQLNPEHGTVIVNLHSDSDILNPDGSFPLVVDHVLPMGKYVSKVGRAYIDVLTGKASSWGVKKSGLAFTVSVPWVCNTSLAVCKGSGSIRAGSSNEIVMNSLVSKSKEVDRILNLPFGSSQYIKSGFVLLE